MGPDQIHLGVLKQHATAVALILTVICNKSLHSGEVPSHFTYLYCIKDNGTHSNKTHNETPGM